jgi:hypothetical protein
MSLRGWALLAFTLWSFSGCFGPTGARVVNPAPISAGVSLEATEQAILDALPRRGWTTETVEPGRIIAFLPVRSHLLRVQIRYDAQQVQVTYVDSANLAEERKGDEIFVHKNVNNWMKKLAAELKQAIAAAGTGQPRTSGGVVTPAEPVTP